MPAAAAVPRKPKQERSAATQRKILDATLHCLAEVGYVKLTLARVAEVAGVSKGALFLHYPSKDCLVAATVDSYFAALADEWPRLAKRVRDHSPERRIRAAIQAWWDIALRPEYRGINDVYGAVRTDAALAAALGPTAEGVVPLTKTAVTELFADLDLPQEQVEKFALIALFTIESAVRDGAAMGNPGAHASIVDHLEEIAHLVLEAGRNEET